MNKIKFSGIQYNQLREHLFPGDHCEAVAIAQCGRSWHGDNHTLTVRELLLVPYDACFERKPDKVSWPTDVINPFLECAAGKGLAIVKIHCHPGYYEKFSETDNYSDRQLFTSIHAWLMDDLPHASCIMLPDGRIFGRFFASDMSIATVHQISVAGSNLYNWYYGSDNTYNEKQQLRNLQAFGKKTIQMLANMKIGIVGCSGTGSIVIEQLKRYGIGTLVQVDPDFVDFLNLNRIINSVRADAKDKVMKTTVSERAIRETGFNTTVISFPTHISIREVIKELAECDFLFSCVDGHEARHILNMIGTMYNIPLIDMGVKIDPEPGGGIKKIFASVHFVQPGGSSLLNRGQYDLHEMRSEVIRRSNKEEVQRNRYLAEVRESSPAVISINMQVAAVAVNEFLARLHPYRNIPNEEIDIVRINFNDCSTYHESFATPCEFFKQYVGKGDIEPLLNNPELSLHESNIKTVIQTPAA